MIRPSRLFALAVAGATAAVAPGREGGGAGESGSLTGKVVVPAGKQLPETVVYLEPTDPSRTFPAPGGPPTPISQKEGKFVPAFLVVPVGASVEFRNDEPTPLEHNIFSRSTPKQFDLGLYGPDAKPRVVTFDKPGEVAYYCSVHRYMDGTIFVTPTPFFAMADKDGGFKITGVPAGEYAVRTWQRRKRFNDAEEKVSVSSGGEASVTLTLNR